MKPAPAYKGPTLFFTVRRFANRRALAVLAVAVEGATMLIGTDGNGHRSSAPPWETRGRFATLELAQAAIASLEQIERDHNGPINRAKLELHKLRISRDEQLRAAWDNLAAARVEPHPVDWPPMVKPARKSRAAA